MTQGFSKSFIRKVASLDDAKGRMRNGAFIAEGTKCVTDLARTYHIRTLAALPEWIQEHGTLGADICESATPAMINSITRLSTRPPVIALFRLPEPDETPAPETAATETFLVLDHIQDPGNMGTILRTCDWMGVRHVIASPDTADAFNPKVVQATMGALAQVCVHYTPLVPWLAAIPQDAPIYGTFLNGADVYHENFRPAGAIIMGNEGRGISKAVESLVRRRITIPAASGACAESLNVATATAIVLGLRQRSILNS